MSHIVFGKGGSQPISVDGGYATGVDMKFELYPKTPIKNKLMMLGAKFYGILPGEDAYLVFDGNNASRQKMPPDDPSFLKLPDNWYDYAEVQFLDGSLKNPLVGV